MTDILSTISTRKTPQSERADARQVKNSAGGYTFEIDDTARLLRFLTLGVDGGTYYASAKDLAKENAAVVFRMAESDPETLLRTIVEVSQAGRAPRQNPTIFALAVACSVGSDESRAAALGSLSLVCRTGTHLFQFAAYVEQFRGWGRGLRRAVANWYLTPEVEKVAYQAAKYQQRDGWSHRDMLRLAHPKTDEKGRNALFEWITKGDVGEDTPRLVEGFLKAREPGANIPGLIVAYGLSWEMLPSESLNDVKVWDALLESGVPATALMRQLPRLTRLGLLPQMGGWTARVAAMLTDEERLKRGRIHPINVLVAQRTYASGRSVRGSSEWQPTRQIVDALDAGFYAAFGAVEPAGKRTMLALDVSGSMMAQIADMPLTCREASAALALVQMATEPDVGVVGFTSGNSGGRWNRQAALTPLSISPRQRLDDALRTVSGLPFGGTDCALPMLTATQNDLKVDSFVVYTDSETWQGDVHAHQALRQYREKSGIDARLVVVGMTASSFTIADPSDRGMLDVSGFDAAIPNVINAFSRGDF